MRVVKRDKTIETFQENKIKRCIIMAAESCEKVIPATKIMQRVCDNITSLNRELIDVDVMQNNVEKVLMESGYHEIAKEYILYKANRDRLRGTRLKSTGCGISDYIHYSKYSRNGESYSETVNRVMQMHIKKFPGQEKILREAFDLVHEKLVLPSMRSMQFAGEPILKDNARLYNCSFTLCNRYSVFRDIFYLLLCGCGVGYSVQWLHVDKLPKIPKISRQVIHYKIPDTIRGWALAVQMLWLATLKSKTIEYSYEDIRPEGSLLRTSGGRAPGHLPLKQCLEECRLILLGAQGRKLRPIEVHDMICYIAQAVLSGGVRRSSLISLFSISDTEMLYSKSPGIFDPMKGLNTQRTLANNSAVLLRSTCSREELNRIIRIADEGYGEPGFYFTNHLSYGTNPCGEIGLDPGNGVSFCNLTEINVARCKNPFEFFEAAKAATIIGTFQAAYSDFTFLSGETIKIAIRDRLLGVSLTGIMDNPDIGLSKIILDGAVKTVKKTNEEIARMININTGARLTCVKPSGTASLALGCIGSGIHPHHARRYFRRIRCNVNEDAFKYFSKINPHMVEKITDRDSCLIFPIECSDNAIVRKNVTSDQFLKWIFTVYESWVEPGTVRGNLTHNISASVEIKKDERNNVIDLVWSNRDKVAALSFIPEVLDTMYPHAPRQSIIGTEKWDYIIRNYKLVDWSKYIGNNTLANACDAEKCDSENWTTF